MKIKEQVCPDTVERCFISVRPPPSLLAYTNLNIDICSWRIPIHTYCCSSCNAVADLRYRFQADATLLRALSSPRPFASIKSLRELPFRQCVGGTICRRLQAAMVCVHFCNDSWTNLHGGTNSCFHGVNTNDGATY